MSTLAVVPDFGRPYGPGPHYTTSEGVDVWMWRKGQRVRFYDTHGTQVGPEHTNVAPAVVWAAFHGWWDPTVSADFNLALIAEVRAAVKGDPHVQA